MGVSSLSSGGAMVHVIVETWRGNLPGAPPREVEVREPLDPVTSEPRAYPWWLQPEYIAPAAELMVEEPPLKK